MAPSRHRSHDLGSALEWLKRAEPGSLRVAGRRGKVEGGLMEVPMGQWFQGRRVATLGVAGVAIAPEARGQGVALALLGATLRAARQRGNTLSTLYPSTYRLYRKAGNELAGCLCRFSLQLEQLQRSRRDLPVPVPHGQRTTCHRGSVSRGRARPSGVRGGVRRARLSVSALAALHGGLVAPRELALNGQLEADEPAQVTLASLFGGPTPACVDYF